MNPNSQSIVLKITWKLTFTKNPFFYVNVQIIFAFRRSLLLFHNIFSQNKGRRKISVLLSTPAI